MSRTGKTLLHRLANRLRPPRQPAVVGDVRWWKERILKGNRGRKNVRLLGVILIVLFALVYVGIVLLWIEDPQNLYYALLGTLATSEGVFTVLSQIGRITTKSGERYSAAARTAIREMPGLSDFSKTQLANAVSKYQWALITNSSTLGRGKRELQLVEELAVELAGRYAAVSPKPPSI